MFDGISKYILKGSARVSNVKKNFNPKIPEVITIYGF